VTDYDEIWLSDACVYARGRQSAIKISEFLKSKTVAVPPSGKTKKLIAISQKPFWTDFDEICYADARWPFRHYTLQKHYNINTRPQILK